MKSLLSRFTASNYMYLIGSSVLSNVPIMSSTDDVRLIEEQIHEQGVALDRELSGNPMRPPRVQRPNPRLECWRASWPLLWRRPWSGRARMRWRQERRLRLMRPGAQHSRRPGRLRSPRWRRRLGLSCRGMICRDTC